MVQTRAVEVPVRLVVDEEALSALCARVAERVRQAVVDGVRQGCEEEGRTLLRLAYDPEDLADVAASYAAGMAAEAAADAVGSG